MRTSPTRPLLRVGALAGAIVFAAAGGIAAANGPQAQNGSALDLAQAVHLLERRQHVVVVDVLVVLALGDVLAVEDRRDLVVLGVVVLVPGDDQDRKSVV